MDYKELYDGNADFRGYVDRYCKTYGLTVDAALEHAIVREYAYCMEKKDLDHD